MVSLLPASSLAHEGDRGCSMHNAAFDIRPAVGRPGRVGGATQPAGQIVLALSGLGLESSSSLPFYRLLHAYQAVAHSSHSNIQIQSGSCEGGPSRGGQRASHRSRVLSFSLPDGLGPQTPLPALRKPLSLQTLPWMFGKARPVTEHLQYQGAITSQ